MQATTVVESNNNNIEIENTDEIKRKCDKLNDNQKKLHAAILEFANSLSFSIWGENNHASRAVKNLQQIMELMDREVFCAFIESYFNQYSENIHRFGDYLCNSELTYIPELPDGDELTNRVAYSLIICLNFYIRLMKTKDDQMEKSERETITTKTFNICQLIIELLKQKGAQIVPHFSAKLFTLVSLVYDYMGKSNTLTKFWFQMLSTQALSHHHESYATLVNLILRSYVNNSLWSQAESFVSKCKMSELASNPQQARYSFYCGMINLIHCQYREALFKFSAAFTCSQNFVAVGFKQACVKFILLSKLLMGDYPDRKLFYNDCYFKSIIPYFDLIKAVKLGSTVLFTKYISENKEYYIRDRTTAIVMRLHHNVLQAALVKLSLSYSSIYLDDVAKKIQLQGPDVEFVVAKAIKDQVINAEIDHEKRVVNFNSFDGYYQTFNSLEVLQARASDCHQLYRKFMTSMKYPRSAYIFDGKNEESVDEFSDMEFLLSLNEDDLL